jgi:hypothetical protein
VLPGLEIEWQSRTRDWITAQVVKFKSAAGNPFFIQGLMKGVEVKGELGRKARRRAK